MAVAELELDEEEEVEPPEVVMVVVELTVWVWVMPRAPGITIPSAVYRLQGSGYSLDDSDSDSWLTADVLDGAAGAVHEDGLAAGDLEPALLHDAGGVVADAVAELAGVLGVTGNLKRSNGFQDSNR